MLVGTSVCDMRLWRALSWASLIPIPSKDDPESASKKCLLVVPLGDCGSF